MNRHALWLSLIIILLLSACSKEIVYLSGSQSVGLDGAESAQAAIEMRSGEISIKGGAEIGLLKADYLYNQEIEPPQITYSVPGNQGDLSISGDNTGGLGFSVSGEDNLWDLIFNDGIPLDLHLSVSDADLNIDATNLSLTSLITENNSGKVSADLSGPQPNLSAVDIKRSNGGRVVIDLSGQYEALSKIDAELNGGNLELDLSGDWANDVEITIGGGTGNDLSLLLPQDTGVTITFEADNNEVTPGDLTANGNIYTNAVYGKTDVTLNIIIQFDRGM